jgi:hypothetical protein
VHYFLGPTPLIEEGSVVPAGSAFCRAETDLRTQNLRLLARRPTPEDSLLAMWTPDGVNVESVDVELGAADGIEGDVLHDPGVDLPPGAAILAQDKGELLFAGLVSARAMLDDGAGKRRFYTFAGFDRVRELLAVPEVWPVDYKARFRPDGITVQQPIR